MTLREQAACAAMTGLLANPNVRAFGTERHGWSLWLRVPCPTNRNDASDIRVSQLAVTEADAVLAALGPDAGEREEASDADKTCQALSTSNLVLRADLASVREQLAQTEAERDKLAKRVAELEAEGHVGYIANFLREALVALAGVVCTPEKGYLVDGGFRQLANDMREFRRLHDEAVKHLRFMLFINSSHVNEVESCKGCQGVSEARAFAAALPAPTLTQLLEENERA